MHLLLDFYIYPHLLTLHHKHFPSCYKLFTNGILNGPVQFTELTKVKEAFFFFLTVNKIIMLQFQIFRNHGTGIPMNEHQVIRSFVHSFGKRYRALLCSKPVTSFRDTVVSKAEAHRDFCLKNTNISELSGEGETGD